MVYFLKFGASWLLPPGIFIVALFALAWYAWKRRGERRIAALLFALTFVFYLLCTSVVAERTLGSLEQAYLPPAEPAGDVIIMLGGGAMPDSPDVDGVGALCASPANRLLTAVRLQRKLGVPILLSGGQVYEDTGAEAKIARRMLIDLGVPEEQILVETRSVNTTQNARYSAEILRAQGLTQPILVTSAFHMKRAVLNFKKQGIDVVPYPADYQVTHHPVFHYTKLRPQTEALLDNVTVLQETLRTLVTRYLE
ncbi:YdcF family protein [uncultured Selenomonas sp.]|uniref:YdcF family protein n=1 Tax=uncultured Selenomonas sp. TaxID=159275 RepID=UPI00258283D4|nr:YdcF family protein [uncultured Selenomonas sp.]